MKRTLVRILGAVFVLIAIPFYWLSADISPSQTALASLVIGIVLTMPGIYLLIHPGVILYRKAISSPQQKTSSGSDV